MSHQRLDLIKKISKRKIVFFNLTFTDFHMGRHGPKSDFQGQFAMSKIVRIFPLVSLKNISLEEGFLLLSFFESLNF